MPPSQSPQIEAPLQNDVFRLNDLGRKCSEMSSYAFPDLNNALAPCADLDSDYDDCNTDSPEVQIRCILREAKDIFARTSEQMQNRFEEMQSVFKTRLDHSQSFYETNMYSNSAAHYEAMHAKINTVLDEVQEDIAGVGTDRALLKSSLDKVEQSLDIVEVWREKMQALHQKSNSTVVSHIESQKDCVKFLAADHQIIVAKHQDLVDEQQILHNGFSALESRVLQCQHHCTQHIQQVSLERAQNAEAIDKVQKELQDAKELERERATQFTRDMESLELRIHEGHRKQEQRLQNLEDSERDGTNARSSLAQVRAAENDRYTELESAHQYIISQQKDLLQHAAPSSVDIHRTIRSILQESNDSLQLRVQRLEAAQGQRKMDDEQSQGVLDRRMSSFNATIKTISERESDTATRLSKISDDLKVAGAMSKDGNTDVENRLRQLERAPDRRNTPIVCASVMSLCFLYMTYQYLAMKI